MNLHENWLSQISEVISRMDLEIRQISRENTELEERLENVEYYLRCLGLEPIFYGPTLKFERPKGFLSNDLDQH